MAENWACHAARNLPLNTEKAWDGGEAHQRMMDRAGIGGDSPDFEKARQGYLLVDDSAKENRTAYSLPFADVLDGTLTALISGCRAAASRLPQKQGVSDAERSKARAVLDGYFKKQDSGKKAAEEEERWLPAVWTTPAPITRLLTSADLPLSALPQVPDPDIFHHTPPFLFRARIATNALDAYHTRMAPSTLQNFERDATAGVAFQNSHRTDELPLGRSFAGQYTGPGGDGNAYTEADFYTLPGLNLNGISTDDLIRGIRSGIVHDCSVGFYGGTMRCILCGRDMLREWRDCGHIPGLPYVTREKDGSEREQTAAAWVENARLAEVSGVYDGATPGAAIIGLKARMEAEMGRLLPEQARMLETQYRLRLPASHRAWAGVDLPELPEEYVHTEMVQVRHDERKEAAMPEVPGQAAPNTPEPPAPLVALRSLLAEAGLTVAADPFETVRAVTAELLELRPLKAEVERLRPLADMGTKYHADERERAIGEGIRAQGADFPAETFKGLLERSTLAEVQALAAGWKATADAKLAGGRVSVDVGEPDPAAANGKAPASHTPVGAYAG